MYTFPVLKLIWRRHVN